MILADTSVWIDHLRRGNAALAKLLEASAVAGHPFVIGELACGTLRNRTRLLELLAQLPGVPVARHEEALALVESHHLMGRGLGWVDVYLIAGALLGGIKLWTLDRPLREVAGRLGIAAQE